MINRDRNSDLVDVWLLLIALVFGLVTGSLVTSHLLSTEKPLSFVERWGPFW